MLHNPIYDIDDQARMRDLIDRWGWMLLCSAVDGGSPVVSHLPVVRDVRSEELAVLGHLARVDADLHRLGEREVTLVVSAEHGYISPTLYGDAGPFVPSWNFVVLHLQGRPEVLDEESTWMVLEQTCRHLEAGYSVPWSLGSVKDYAKALLPHVTGFRLRPTSILTKSKLSQDKDPLVVERMIQGLSSGEYANQALAASMRRYS